MIYIWIIDYNPCLMVSKFLVNSAICVMYFGHAYWLLFKYDILLLAEITSGPETHCTNAFPL